MPARRRVSNVRQYRPSGGWAGAIIQQTAVAANSSVLLATFTPSVALTLTVRRIRVSVLYSSDQNAASESSLGALGAAVMEDTAIAVGAASLPDPVSDVADDYWLMFQGLHTRISVRGTDGQVEPAGFIAEIDSKAMRKLPTGKSLVFIVANSSATAGALIQLTIRVYTTLARA